MRESTELNQNEQERLRALDLLRFQVDELGKARLTPGEDERLDSERAVLRNIEKVRLAASTAYAALYEDEGSALERLAAVNRSLDELERYDAALVSHREPAIAARAALDDLARALGDYLSRLEADPGRLDQVEERLALLDRLKRKYGGTMNEVLAFADQVREDLARIEHTDARREELRRELASADDAYRKIATALSGDRRGAASRLSDEVRKELSHLGMDKARFEVGFEDVGAPLSATSETPEAAGGPKGIDRVTFLVSANPGEELRPLDRDASWGRDFSPNAGAQNGCCGCGQQRERQSPYVRFRRGRHGYRWKGGGGSGRATKTLGSRESGAFSHSPSQIACFADHHYSVEKVARAGRTFAAVQYLATERERAAELARMLSGRRITEAVLEHATAMLKQGSRR